MLLGVEAGTQRACQRERARTGGSCSRRASVNAAWPPVKRCESVTWLGVGLGLGETPTLTLNQTITLTLHPNPSP